MDRDIAVSRNMKKIGIEHVKDEDVIKALSMIRKVNFETTSDISYGFLTEIGVIGSKNSKRKRDELSKKLNIGLPNGKTLFHRLRMFNIKKSDIL
ncbi:DUF4093 domain-containing protein, partial [Arthrospira platensis SPKY2]